jgi:catechol 2,3-dioxygenase-like lactoylglutathione lyase family enzyme
VANVRYMVDDVDSSIAFYTSYFGFELLTRAGPAFADIVLGDLRLLLSGPESSGRRALSDGARPVPGGWNRIQLVVDDIAAEVKRLDTVGVQPRSGIVSGPGGSQVLFSDPDANLVELFQPAH